MIITFTGAQSTGKSTLLDKCTYDGRFNYYSFVPEITRKLKKKYNLTINENGDEYTQLFCINSHLENYLSHKGSKVVLDRCALDALVYTTYQYHTGKVNEWVMEYATNLFESLKDKYDIIFYTEPDIDLVDDGERSSSNEFRDTIVKLFEEAIDHYNIKVVRLKGTVEERMVTIYKTLDKINYGK